MLLIGGICMFVLPIALYPEIARRRSRSRRPTPGPTRRPWPTPSPRRSSSRSTASRGMIYFTPTTPATALEHRRHVRRRLFAGHRARSTCRTASRRPRRACPPEVKQFGVTIKKTSTDMVCVVNLVSPDGRYDATFLDNYGQIYVLDGLKRIPGVSDVSAVRPQVRDADLARPEPDGQRADPAGRSHRRRPVREQAGRRRQDRRAPVPTGQLFEYPVT